MRPLLEEMACPVDLSLKVGKFLIPDDAARLLVLQELMKFAPASSLLSKAPETDELLKLNSDRVDLVEL